MISGWKWSFPEMYFLTNDMLITGASKGNQEKWYDAESDRWYKLDQFGYEALSETFVSILLEHSNLKADTPFQFVTYQMERIKRNSAELVGCSSGNFLKAGQSIITVGSLLKKGLTAQELKAFANTTSLSGKIEQLAKIVSELTQLEYFPQYLTLLFEIDSLCLNDDRHLNNIAVIEDANGFSYCPIFDHGAALLSNLVIGSLSLKPASLHPFLSALPFGVDFSEQASAARQLFGAQLRLPIFSKSELRKLVSPLTDYYRPAYRAAIADRVVTTILIRQSL